MVLNEIHDAIVYHAWLSYLLICQNPTWDVHVKPVMKQIHVHVQETNWSKTVELQSTSHLI